MTSSNESVFSSLFSSAILCISIFFVSSSVVDWNAEFSLMFVSSISVSRVTIWLCLDDFAMVLKSFPSFWMSYNPNWNYKKKKCRNTKRMFLACTQIKFLYRVIFCLCREFIFEWELVWEGMKRFWRNIETFFYKNFWFFLLDLQLLLFLIKCKVRKKRIWWLLSAPRPYKHIAGKEWFCTWDQYCFPHRVHVNWQSCPTNSVVLESLIQ